jgi:hypothetical protein
MDIVPSLLPELPKRLLSLLGLRAAPQRFTSRLMFLRRFQRKKVNGISRLAGFYAAGTTVLPGA